MYIYNLVKSQRSMSCLHLVRSRFGFTYVAPVDSSPRASHFTLLVAFCIAVCRAEFYRQIKVPVKI